MKKIILPNRYGDKNYLEEISPHFYKLHLVCDQIRAGYNEANQYSFIDPSGGPFMGIGDKIDKVEGVLDKIEPDPKGGFMLNFKV